MKPLSALFLKAMLRATLLIAGAVLGTITLMHWAPGYYSDTRELDTQSASLIRQALVAERLQDHGTLAATWHWTTHALHGNLGTSRHLAAPVSQLIRERSAVTLHLLVPGLFLAWSGACCVSVLVSVMQKRQWRSLLLVPASGLLTVPVGAIAMLCFLTNLGGPVLVLALLLGAREFQFFERLLRDTLSGPHYLYLRAIGVKRRRILAVIVPAEITPQVLALVLRSFLTGIGLLVPIEVIFDEPGLGQLAWASMMNRDMPVLVAVTILFAAAFALLGTIADATLEVSRA